MLDDCRHFLCPNDIAKDEVAKEHTIEQSLQENERERKRLILDLEKAGVNFPVTELETMASKRLIGEHVRLAGDPEDLPEQKVVKGHLAQEDYATNMPDDLKELLRRYYQLEAERESLKQGGTETAPNSVFGDEENQTESLAKVETPRAPFWFFRRRSVAIVENETNRFYETQERSGRSRHVWVPSKDGDDASHSSSRVTVIYPKEHTRKIRLGLFVCCLILLGLIAVIAFYANQHNEKDSNMTKALPLVAESATKSPADKFSPLTTADSCMDEIDLTKGCFVRGEPVGAQFKNCNPLPDDWLAVYPSTVIPSELGDDSLAWMYTCGNKQCRGVVQASFYSFQIFEPGSYRIHLIRNRDEKPYSAFASTVEFDVMQNRLDCPTEVDP